MVSDFYARRAPHVRAHQWTGDNYDEIREFATCPVRVEGHTLVITSPPRPDRAQPGDWVTMNSQGDMFVMDARAFDVLYEKVPDTTEGRVWSRG